MQKTLRSSEWILVGSLLIIFASLLLIAKINAFRSSSSLTMQRLPAHEHWPVKIEGAVKKPGTYKAIPGTQLKQILLKSRPSRIANLKKIDLDQRIECPMEILVEEISEITIRVVGAVLEPSTLTLSPGTRVCDLKAKIHLRNDADKSLFKSRRMLKDGEILVVLKKGD